MRMDNTLKGSFILNDKGVLKIEFQNKDAARSKRVSKYTYDIKFNEETVKMGYTEQSPHNSAKFIEKRGYTQPSKTTEKMSDEIKKCLESGGKVGIEYTEHLNTVTTTKDINKKRLKEHKEKYGEYPKYNKQIAGKKW